MLYSSSILEAVVLASVWCCSKPKLQWLGLVGTSAACDGDKCIEVGADVMI